MRKLRSVVIALAALWFVGCSQQDSNSEHKSATQAEVSTNAPTQGALPAGSSATADFSKLKGRWERPDGGYVLEIREIAADGKAEAGYFNPSPIKIERAQIYSESGATKLFVILRDVNYPGCTYTLTYDAKADQLFGKYFQAAMQETYDVTFARLK